MTDQQKTWLIIALFVLILGLLSASIQGGARRVSPAASRPAPSEKKGVKVDPIRGVVGSDEGARYFQ